MMLSISARIWSGQNQRLAALVRRFGKFGVVGASGVGVNMTVFWLLTSSLQLHYLAAGALAIETAMCSNYILNNNWTFADRRAGFSSLRGAARYHVVSFGGMLINLVVLHLLAGGVGINPMFANLAGIGMATGWNFSLSLSWAWRRPRQAAALKSLSR